MTTLRLAVATALASGMVASALCPAARAAEGEVYFGSQWWDQTAPDAKYQEFSEVPRGGFLESFLLREWSGRNSLALWGANAIRTDQASKLTWANGARWRLDLGHAQIPHTFSHIARWGWTQNAPGLFTLPDSLQTRNQDLPSGYTPRMSDFLREAPGIDLGFQTNLSTARARARLARGWQLEARGSARKRSGNKPYALDFGFSTALENPEPIDQTTVDADLIASFQRGRFRAQASAGLSRFDNDISTLLVDNPKRITDLSGGDGAKVGALDLYPDNQVARGSMALAYLLPKRTAIAATLGVAAGRQDDDFLPFTTNTAIELGTKATLDSLPARTLDGQTVQLNGDVRLTTSPVTGLDGTLRFHFTDFDNQTEERTFIGQSPYDVSWQRFIHDGSYGQHNHIFSNQQWQVGADLDYAFGPRVKVGALAEYRARERTEREVEKDKETVLGGRMRLRPGAGVEVTARYRRGDRELDEFLLEEYEGLKSRLATTATPGLFDSLGFIEQPGLRRFDVADRVQDDATVGVSYLLGERLELSGSYFYLRNDFAGDTTLGLQEEKVQTVLSSATFHANDRLDLTGGFGLGLGETFQKSRSSPYSRAQGVNMFEPDSNWTANLKDDELFVFAGLDWAATEKLGFGANYQVSRTESEFDLDNGLHNAADLPNTLYRRHELVVDARWRWLANTTVVGRYGWEEYDVDDWAVNDVPLIFPVTGTANAIFLGDSAQSYKAHRVALLVRHRF